MVDELIAADFIINEKNALHSYAKWKKVTHIWPMASKWTMGADEWMMGCGCGCSNLAWSTEKSC